MSQENVEFVRSLYRPNDPSRFFELLDDDVEVVSGQVLPDHPDLIRGKHAVTDMYRHYWGTWGDYVLEPTEIMDAGEDRVLALYEEQGRGKGSGVPFTRRFGVLLTVHASRVARLQYFDTHEQALEAAGLRE